MYRVAVANGKVGHILDEFASNEDTVLTLCGKHFDTHAVHAEDDLPNCEQCDNKFE